jgi:hypothetical protein
MPEKTNNLNEAVEYLKTGREAPFTVPEEDEVVGPDEEVLCDSSELPPFWKPEVPGERLQGVLTRIKETQYGPALRVRDTEERVHTVAINETMMDIDFERVLGRRLTFVFKGYVETKKGNKIRTFKITAKQEDDRAPF